jgi:hypothetical protein
MVNRGRWQEDRKTERQKDRKTERQKDRKTERQKDRKTELQWNHESVQRAVYLNALRQRAAQRVDARRVRGDGEAFYGSQEHGRCCRRRSEGNGGDEVPCTVSLWIVGIVASSIGRLWRRGRVKVGGGSVKDRRCDL